MKSKFTSLPVSYIPPISLAKFGKLYDSFHLCYSLLCGSFKPEVKNVYHLQLSENFCLATQCIKVFCIFGQ